ncbi:GrpB family protein [Paenibacillus sp. JTLBN-2024]
MEIVTFLDHNTFKTEADHLFMKQKSIIKAVLPNADVQHVGSTAIPNSLTKGDLDIQVRIEPAEFENAVEALSKLYAPNEGSIQTESFRAFKDDTTIPPLGIQLTVVHSEFDFFWKFRDVLLSHDRYRQKYDELKKKYEGKDMELYRQAKNDFFEWLMETPEFTML